MNMLGSDFPANPVLVLVVVLLSWGSSAASSVWLDGSPVNVSCVIGKHCQLDIEANNSLENLVIRIKRLRDSPAGNQRYFYVTHIKGRDSLVFALADSNDRENANVNWTVHDNLVTLTIEKLRHENLGEYKVELLDASKRRVVIVVNVNLQVPMTSPSTTDNMDISSAPITVWSDSSPRNVSCGIGSTCHLELATLGSLESLGIRISRARYNSPTDFYVTHTKARDALYLQPVEIKTNGDANIHWVVKSNQIIMTIVELTVDNLGEYKVEVLDTSNQWEAILVNVNLQVHVPNQIPTHSPKSTVPRAPEAILRVEQRNSTTTTTIATIRQEDINTILLICILAVVLVILVVVILLLRYIKHPRKQDKSPEQHQMMPQPV